MVTKPLSATFNNKNSACFRISFTGATLTGYTNNFTKTTHPRRMFCFLTVHLDSVLVNNQPDAQTFFSYKSVFIPILYMFRAPLCSKSGEAIPTKPAHRSTYLHRVTYNRYRINPLNPELNPIC